MLPPRHPSLTGGTLNRQPMSPQPQMPGIGYPAFYHPSLKREPPTGGSLHETSMDG
ncbi:unnamed protein product [Protopolystoma xenopodis]|uniref:Uncharacterized protein n=1 Tax=Protopolystoma xenopodis TaxID=117903 RepID=A0A3S5AQ83_9PLAT|nr:unnamed protein product [Protopolystoma xenopodis]